MCGNVKGTGGWYLCNGEGWKVEVLKSEYPSFLAVRIWATGLPELCHRCSSDSNRFEKNFGDFFETAWSICGCSRVHRYVTMAIGSLHEGPSVQVSLVQDGVIYSLG